MSDDGTQSFETGPKMMNPVFGMVLALGCIALAAAQAWPVIGHYSGARQLAAHEPAARIVFGLVFLAAAFGIAVALLERRNARVKLGSDSLTVHTWWGGQRHVRYETVESLVLLRPRDEETEILFHWLFVTTDTGRSVPLSGGPWPAPRSVEVLRHELADLLFFEERDRNDARWAAIFAAERIEFS